MTLVEAKERLAFSPTRFVVCTRTAARSHLAHSLVPQGELSRRQLAALRLLMIS